jgi:5-carboxymethyl-2-hydroxymuconate isomerase
MESMINVGTSKETVQEAGKQILAILEARADQVTLVAALDILARITEVHCISISNNTLENKE